MSAAQETSPTADAAEPASPSSIKSDRLLEQLATAFAKLDVNKNGKIGRSEFINGIMNDKEMQEILNLSVDDEKDAVSPTQASMSESRGNLRDQAKLIKRRGKKLGVALEYFKRLDVDGDGEVDVKEFSDFFSSEKLSSMIEKQLEAQVNKTENLSPEDVAMLKQLFELIDTDRSGLLSYLELSKALGYAEARKWFQRMDSDKNAYIGVDEVIRELDGKFKGVDAKKRVDNLGELAKRVKLKMARMRKRQVSAFPGQLSEFPGSALTDKKAAPKAEKKAGEQNGQSDTTLIDKYIGRLRRDSIRTSDLSAISTAIREE